MDTFCKQDEEALEPEVESSQLIAAETLDRFATSGCIVNTRGMTRRRKCQWRSQSQQADGI